MGPLRLDWRYLPKALPWFTRLLLNLRQRPYRNSVAALRALNEASLDAWRRLLGSTGNTQLLKEDGSLLVFERPESRTAIDALKQKMQAQGVPVDFWDANAVRNVAPQLSESIQGALFFPATGHFIDPHQVVRALVQAAQTRVFASPASASKVAGCMPMALCCAPTRARSMPEKH